MPFPAASPHKEEAMQALREGVAKQEVAKRFGITIRSAERYLKELQNPKPKKTTKAPSETPKTSASGGQLAAITAKTPAPILFTLGEVQIPLNPQYMYDAYLYYRDIQRIDPDMDDEFSMAIKVAMKHVWEKFTKEEAEKIGVTITEG